MNSYVFWNMFPQVIGSDVKHFTGVQRTPSLFRANRRMGCASLKGKYDRVHCLVAKFSCTGKRPWMPCQRYIQIFEKSFFP